MTALVVVPAPRLTLVGSEDTVHAELARILEPHVRRAGLRVIRGGRD